MSSIIEDQTLSDAALEYQKLRPQYESFASEVERILTNALQAERITCQSIECRSKLVSSFDKKCKKQESDGSPKYTDPLTQITDLAGVRVILFTMKDVNRTCQFLDKYFDCVEKTDVGERRYEEGKFGYQSIHYLLKLPHERLILPENAAYNNLICEVQVRTILQHAWAEMEHDVQYKTEADIPESIARKFLSLAGLLEIADREFQAIQDEDQKIKSSILSDLEDDLTLDALSKPKNTEERVASGEPPNGQSEAKNVRSLLLEGRIAEAIEVYDRKIEFEPNSYTLYLGRAKARFLSGDVTGAHTDVDRASELNPDSVVIENLRQRMINGRVEILPPTAYEPSANDLINQGHAALRAAEGDKAYNYYTLAQNVGASFPFSVLNKAMACTVAGDIEGSKLHLAKLRINPGTPMEINIQGLAAINMAIEESGEFTNQIELIADLIKKKADYVVQLSPLPILFAGLDNTHFENPTAEKIEIVFDVLNAEP